MYTYYTRVYYNLFRIIRFKPVFVARVAFICGKGVIYPYINKSPFCVRTQYTLRRLFPFFVLYCVVTCFLCVVRCLFGICFYCSFSLLYCCFYSVVFCIMQRYFSFCFRSLFPCYGVKITHKDLMPFFCCVRTQTKFNCVRTQCVVFCAGI